MNTNVCIFGGIYIFTHLSQRVLKAQKRSKTATLEREWRKISRKHEICIYLSSIGTYVCVYVKYMCIDVAKICMKISHEISHVWWVLVWKIDWNNVSNELMY